MGCKTNYNSSNGYNWCNVNSDGSANNNNGNNTNGFAPDSYKLIGSFKVTYTSEINAPHTKESITLSKK